MIDGQPEAVGVGAVDQVHQAELVGKRGRVDLLEAQQVEVVALDQREQLADCLVLLEVVAEDAHRPNATPATAQPGSVMLRTSSAASSWASVSSPRSTKPRSIAASRTVMPFATECLAILAAFS